MHIVLLVSRPPKATPDTKFCPKVVSIKQMAGKVHILGPASAYKKDRLTDHSEWIDAGSLRRKHGHKKGLQ